MFKTNTSEYVTGLVVSVSLQTPFLHYDTTKMMETKKIKKKKLQTAKAELSFQSH